MHRYRFFTDLLIVAYTTKKLHGRCKQTLGGFKLNSQGQKDGTRFVFFKDLAGNNQPVFCVMNSVCRYHFGIPL